jgi:hypothetical protein
VGKFGVSMENLGFPRETFRFPMENLGFPRENLGFPIKKYGKFVVSMDNLGFWSFQGKKYGFQSIFLKFGVSNRDLEKFGVSTNNFSIPIKNVGKCCVSIENLGFLRENLGFPMENFGFPIEIMGN